MKIKNKNQLKKIIYEQTYGAPNIFLNIFPVTHIGEIKVMENIKSILKRFGGELEIDGGNYDLKGSWWQKRAKTTLILIKYENEGEAKKNYSKLKSNSQLMDILKNKLWYCNIKIGCPGKTDIIKIIKDDEVEEPREKDPDDYDERDEENF